MKFARYFQERLRQDGYPPEWIDSAISYGQLKKCIKCVQRELSALGLDVETLRRLLAFAKADQDSLSRNSSTTFVANNPSNNDDPVRQSSIASTGSLVSNASEDEIQKQPFQYTFLKGNATPSRRIVPKLLFVVDAETGDPLTAELSPDTRNYLHQLAISENLTTVRVTPASESDIVSSFEDPQRDDARPVRFVQVPLTTDGDFFHVLEKEFTGLAALQTAERNKLTCDIQTVGSSVSKATNPDSKASCKDLARWRQLLECYVDARVFFATNERDHGSRGSAEAAKKFALFVKNANSAHLLEGFKTHGSMTALAQFLKVNRELLACLKFQEINHVAMTKILKSKQSVRVCQLCRLVNDYV